MNMEKRLISLIAIVTIFSAHVLAWDGSGTETSPYLVKSTDDWKAINTTLNQGTSLSGKVFRLTANIDADGVSVGEQEAYPFDGVFDGDGHTVTYWKENSDERCAPFRWVSGATIRHLRTTGRIVSSQQYAAGVVSMVKGTSASHLFDCQTDMDIWNTSSTPDNAAHGGMVGAVASGGLSIENCVFSGYLAANYSAGMVGWTNVDVSITHCMVSPSIKTPASNCFTYYRKAGEATVTLKECYRTNAYEPTSITPQGEGVLSKMTVPEGCSYKMESEPDIYFDGVPYWKSGAWVTLTAPDDMPFDHWFTGLTNCLFIKDPWTKNGRHQIFDVNGNPTIQVSAQMPAASDDHFKVRNGIRYRYLHLEDYHLYTSDEDCRRKGWYFKDDNYLYVKDGEGTEYYVTALVGYDSDSKELNRTLSGRWPWSDDQFTGTAVPIDLLNPYSSHTHLGVIAPRAFKDCKELRRLVFISDDGDDPFHHNDLGVDLEIGAGAFANCPNLEAVVMMYYSYTGDDHWEIVKSDQVACIADDAFSGSVYARVLVDPGEYQNYLNSNVWRNHQQRIGLYTSNVQDMGVNGARYSYMRNSKGEAVKNDAAGHEALMQTLSLWNADYQQLSATSLLAPQDYKNIWYAQVVGCNDEYLRRNNGVMRIYNDPGSYYNYKTLAIAPFAFKNCTDLRAIEFWQTNGHVENSYTDLKMVIQNSAFAHCDSLKELRMYYYCQDGDDHWEALGPENVIPGDNIFGVLRGDDNYTHEEYMASSVIPSDFRIVVSPERYQDFLDDPNWAPYADRIVAADYEPSSWSPLNVNGLTYNYACKSLNTTPADQVVTQNLSWWNVPIKIYEAITLYQMASSVYAFATNDKFWFSLKKAINDILSSKSQLEVAKGIQDAGLKQKLDIAKLLRTDVKPIYEPQVDKILEGGADGYFLIDTSNGMEAIEEEIIVRMGNDRAAWTKLAREKLMGSARLRALASRCIEETAVGFRNGILAGFKKQVTEAWKDLAVRLRDLGALIGNNVALGGAYAAFRAMGSDMSEEQFHRGLVENIKANMHKVSYENTMVYTPDKKLIYHVYVEKTTDNKDSITICNDIGQAYNYRTVGISKKAFQGNSTLRTVNFAENAYAGSDSYVPLMLAIPDSAFANCKNLERFALTYKTRNGGWRSLGPENFILGGDSIFAGCDSTKLKIVIDIERKDDFLNDDIWKNYQRYFVYTDVKPETPYSEYGVNYAFAYDNNTTQRVSKVSGHKIEHLVAVSPNDKFLNANQGSMGLFNDIGSYNNYKLDEVRKRAFKGNKAVRAVSFWDLEGGDAYTDLDMELGDSCFADCSNLANIDMLYCVTDGDDHIELLRPSQVRAGKGMLDGTQARIKMMPQQVAWFEADSAWNKYRDRFLPCIIQPADKGVKKALKDMCYYTPCRSPYRWTDYIDLARIGGAGFSWLDGRFTAQKDDIMSFADFKRFEWVGLDYVGAEWFKDCGMLSNILLPSTVKAIRSSAFENCGKLQEIELPAAVETIARNAFRGCALLTTIVVKGKTPAKVEENVFPKNDGMKIYVPTGTEEAYRKAWPDYADYIVGEQSRPFSKFITTTKKGELAEKLGIYTEISYSGPFYGDEMRYLHGNYAKYDSLTISGPLDDLDLSVLRYLAGADSYNSGGGEPTDGQLRYLDLRDAQIRQGSKYNYIFYGNDMYADRYDIEVNDELPLALFTNCSALETLILPSSLTRVRTEAFKAPNLKRIAFTNDASLIYNNLHKGVVWNSAKLLESPLQELVLLTEKPASTASADPWGQNIQYVYTYPSQLPYYAGHDDLSRVTSNLSAPFEEPVMKALTDKRHYFPSEYLKLESVEDIFKQNTDIVTFDDFWRFCNVKKLENTFYACYHLKRITLPASVTEIDKWAFGNCMSLDTIHIYADSVPQLAQDAFADLPANFRILVPRSHLKRYQEQWTQYADHIFVDEESYAKDDLVEVTLTEPNTLDAALGLEVVYKYDWKFNAYLPKAMKGDYSHIRRLKVNGPISGGDLALIRHMAGFTPWSKSRNYLGHLEYVDLYDANLVESRYETTPDKLTLQATIFNPSEDATAHVVEDNILPKYALLKCYALKTLILPKTCKEVHTRALQECEDLETLVIGDDMTDFNWSALDDCASMVRLFILTPQKLKISSEFFIWRWLCNNYNPTFDAFYVRPSLYQDYTSDPTYTGSSWQRTNNISHGMFTDDAAFSAFAAHAAVTVDELAKVQNIDGWFDGRQGGIKDLTPLRYTAIDTLRLADFEGMNALEQIALPSTLTHLDDHLFRASKQLRYVDALLCDTLAPQLREQGLDRLGINNRRTLVYVPNKYGATNEANVVVAGSTPDESLHAHLFYLNDSISYGVPYAFETDSVQNSRTLPTSAIPYTVCVPYKLKVPLYSRAYKLDSRDGSTLTFSEVSGELEPLQPYLIKAVGNKRFYKKFAVLDTDMAQTIPASKGTTVGASVHVPGYTLRGTLDRIDNKTASEMGAYILQSDGDWHRVSSNTEEQQQAVISPFRAYLLAGGSMAKSIGMQLFDNDPTAIDTIRTIDADGTEHYYDLQGRQLNGKPHKGVYIYKGKKYAK